MSTRKPHWVIISDSKSSIWKQPYPTYELAKRELDIQSIAHPVHDWVIEEHSHYAKEDY